MNTVRNFTTIYLQLNYIEVGILSVYLSFKVCVPSKTEDLDMHVLNMI